MKLEKDMVTRSLGIATEKCWICNTTVIVLSPIQINIHFI